MHIEVKIWNLWLLKTLQKKWNISERRIRQLLKDGRIDGAVKNGNSWNIPIDATKPADKRVIKADNLDFIIDLEDNYFNEMDKLKKNLIVKDQSLRRL